jgi:deoxyribodipyrimidine photo-lyase
MSRSSDEVAKQETPLILWFRDDLRLSDNPALVAAAKTGQKIIPVFILDEDSPGLRPLGGASRWWLHGSLESLQRDIALLGGTLALHKGAPANILQQIVAKTGATGLFWNRRYGEAERSIDGGLKEQFSASGIAVKSFNANLLREPWEVETKAGTPMKVFTPYWRAFRAKGEPHAPLPVPANPVFASQDQQEFSEALAAFRLRPEKPDWAVGIRAQWTPGEKAAAESAGLFLQLNSKNYSENRNRPDKASTSRLSPHFRFGEISPRQVWYATKLALASETIVAQDSDLDKFLSEIGWREFSYHLLYYFPGLATQNFQNRFDAFPWEPNPAHLKAWQNGQTGYPIVDAGMRELWQTGWMHNRVRMITASFLIKHLMIDWRCGEAWFWDTLVDADPAANAASWQWVAGSGADAAPYYRIFAPVVQGEKFDPKGDYIRRYVPELAGLPNALIHKPWDAPHPILNGAGITLGRTYPRPIIDHAAARNRALDAFKSLRKEETADENS